MAANLTTAQRRLIVLLADGWELALSGGIDSSAWIQKGGAGRGGESRHVHAGTFNGLWDRKLIEDAGKGPGLGRIYRLTESGRAAATLLTVAEREAAR